MLTPTLTPASLLEGSQGEVREVELRTVLVADWQRKKCVMTSSLLEDEDNVLATLKTSHWVLHKQ